MIVSFYDKNFKGLQNNASLAVDSQSYSLVKRGVDFDSLSCKCEPFTENIQPTFLIVKNDRGNYVYGCLAGIPALNENNQTEIVGSDLKTMLKSDVVFDLSLLFEDVNSYLSAVFTEWKEQVNQNSFTARLVFAFEEAIAFENLEPQGEKPAVYNAWEDLLVPYLKYYGLFMTSEIDLVNKAVVFTVGKSMCNPKGVKLWELGIKNYGKWVATVNETQCIIYNSSTASVAARGYRWILTSQNAITTDAAKRDIFPVKRKVLWKEASDASQISALLAAGNQEALEELTKSMFNENLEISGMEADFQTRFDLYVRRGEEKYKSLPCGELHYNASGLVKVQAGYRFTGIQFLL